MRVARPSGSISRFATGHRRPLAAAIGIAMVALGAGLATPSPAAAETAAQGAGLATPSPAAAETTAAPGPITPATGLPAGMMPLTDTTTSPGSGATAPGSPTTPAGTAPPGAQLAYYGGHIIPSVQVIQVLYGTGTYTPEVSDSSSTDGTSIASFYKGVTASTYIDWLSEYNTTFAGGTQQTIGRGAFVRQVQITPLASRDGSTVDDPSIRAELQAQITAGHLPAPSTNTLYALYFPDRPPPAPPPPRPTPPASTRSGGPGPASSRPTPSS
jgi:hypothetical protein